MANITFLRSERYTMMIREIDMAQDRKKGFYWKRAGILAAAGLFLCGCGEKGTAGKELKTDRSISAEETAGTPEEQETVTLDWYINFSWFTTPWGDNAVSKKITADTGVNINFITPKGNETEKFNALISSDTLPDIITLGWWEPQVDEMIDRKMVYALNELADEYDPYFFEVTDERVYDWYTKEDGNIYCYPNSSYLAEDYESHDNIGSNQTFLVRKDMYEAIGRPDMTTPEGFMEAVRKAAEMFPEIDGRPIIPIGAHAFTLMGCDSFDQFLQNFLAVPYEKDGKYYDRYTDSEYIRWLKAFRQLGEEGYLKEDIFIDQRTQMEEKIEQGRYFCMIYQRTDLSVQQKVLYRNDPDSIYIAVDGPKNSAGDDYVLPGAGISGWTVSLISKNCLYPDKAIELFSYLISEEGQKAVYLGVEGVTYDMVDGTPVIREEVLQLLNTDRQEYDRLYGGDDAYWMFQDNVMQLKWRPPLSDPLGQMEEWTYPYTYYLEQYTIDLETNSKVGYADMKIKELWGNVLPKLLLAPSEEEFDSILEEYIKKRDVLGFDQVMEEKTKGMIKAKEKLGFE